MGYYLIRALGETLFISSALCRKKASACGDMDVEKAYIYIYIKTQ